MGRNKLCSLLNSSRINLFSVSGTVLSGPSLMISFSFLSFLSLPLKVVLVFALSIGALGIYFIDSSE